MAKLIIIIETIKVFELENSAWTKVRTKIRTTQDQTYESAIRRKKIFKMIEKSSVKKSQRVGSKVVEAMQSLFEEPVYAKSKYYISRFYVNNLRILGECRDC